MDMCTEVIGAGDMDIEVVGPGEMDMEVAGTGNVDAASLFATEAELTITDAEELEDAQDLDTTFMDAFLPPLDPVAVTVVPASTADRVDSSIELKGGVRTARSYDSISSGKYDQKKVRPDSVLDGFVVKTHLSPSKLLVLDKMKEDLNKQRSAEYQQKKLEQKDVNRRTEARKLSQWIGLGGEAEATAPQTGRPTRKRKVSSYVRFMAQSDKDFAVKQGKKKKKEEPKVNLKKQQALRDAQWREACKEKEELLQGPAIREAVCAQDTEATPARANNPTASTVPPISPTPTVEPMPPAVRNAAQNAAQKPQLEAVAPMHDTPTCVTTPAPTLAMSDAKKEKKASAEPLKDSSKDPLKYPAKSSPAVPTVSPSVGSTSGAVAPPAVAKRRSIFDYFRLPKAEVKAASSSTSSAGSAKATKLTAKSKAVSSRGPSLFALGQFFPSR
jgi:hypothetical protein